MQWTSTELQWVSFDQQWQPVAYIIADPLTLATSLLGVYDTHIYAQALSITSGLVAQYAHEFIAVPPLELTTSFDFLWPNVDLVADSLQILSSIIAEPIITGKPEITIYLYSNNHLIFTEVISLEEVISGNEWIRKRFNVDATGSHLSIKIECTSLGISMFLFDYGLNLVVHQER